MNTILRTAIAMAAAAPALLADIGVGANTPTPYSPTQVQGNCDLLASNAVRATFIGLRDMPTQSITEDTPTTIRVAIFQVIDNIGHRRYVRYGDGPLAAGTRFSVSMSRELPGQPAGIADEIGKMQPGDEAVLKIDHLYIFGEGEGTAIRPCTRIARAKAQQPAPAQLDNGAQGQPGPAIDPATGQPIQAGQASIGYYRNNSVESNGRKVETITHKLPGSDEVVTRTFINGVEVDPNTLQPLQPGQQGSKPVHPTPKKPLPGDNDDDTVIEHAPDNATHREPDSGETISDEDSF